MCLLLLRLRVSPRSERDPLKNEREKGSTHQDVLTEVKRRERRGKSYLRPEIERHKPRKDLRTDDDDYDQQL